MSQKNTLENKRLRKAMRTKDRGYPSFYEQDKSKPEDIMTMTKFMRLGFYSKVLASLGLVTDGGDI